MSSCLGVCLKRKAKRFQKRFSSLLSIWTVGFDWTTMECPGDVLDWSLEESLILTSSSQSVWSSSTENNPQNIGSGCSVSSLIMIKCQNFAFSSDYLILIRSVYLLFSTIILTNLLALAQRLSYYHCCS